VFANGNSEGRTQNIFRKSPMYFTCDTKVALAIREQCCKELSYLQILDVHLFCSSIPLPKTFDVFTGLILVYREAQSL